MAVRRPTLVDDRELFGEYPFLPGAESLVADLAPSLHDVLTDAAYRRARDLGRARIRAAVDDPTGAQDLEELSRASREERFLSFLYARLVLSSATAAAPLRRWAVAEAKRGWRQFDGAPVGELLQAARHMGYEFEESGGEIRIPLPEYLRLATAIREKDFRLVYQGVRGGRVHVARKRAARLLQEGVRISLTHPIALAAEVKSVVQHQEAEFLAEVAARVPTPASQGSTAGPVRPDLFPPCIRKMRRMLEASENLSHSGRFALAAFLHRTGADFETIVDAFRGAPDFDESITRYQVEHITTHHDGRGYEPPECATLRTHGLCLRDGDPTAPLAVDREPDPRCFDEKLRHPVQYYRWRGGAVKERAEPGG